MASNSTNLPPSPPLRRHFWRYSAIAVASALLVSLALWPQWSELGGRSFMPHGYCLLWRPSLMLLHALSDALIAASYITIALTLGYLVYRARRKVPFHWVFLAFGVFIIACGLTHIMGVITLWLPYYWLSGDVKAITAAASVATAIVLPGTVPRVLAVIESARLEQERKQQLEIANRELIAAGAVGGEELQRAHDAERAARQEMQMTQRRY